MPITLLSRVAAPVPANPHALPPDRIAGYRVVRALTGEQSHLAVSDSGRDVVIKRLDSACLTPDGQLHPTVRDRLSRVRELATPGIVNLLSVERDCGHAFLVWDYLQGRTLSEWLSTHPSLHQRRLAAREIVLTLEALHIAGLAHGAIHARNILLDPQGRWWLTHVSPLLVTDVRDDVEALEHLLREMNLESSLPRSAPNLRHVRLALAGLIEARDAPGAGVGSQDRRDHHARRQAILLAIAVVILAVAASYAIFLWARS